MVGANGMGLGAVAGRHPLDIERRSGWCAITERPAAQCFPAVRRQPVGQRHTIHEDKVHQFAELMRTGRWTDTWVPIMLDRYGNLVNGLHRLSAVVESGCTVVLNVATGFTSTRAANVRARNPNPG